MKRLETTLLLLRKDDQILLAMKKRGFGIGKYNGVGGKLEEGETPEMAMIREAQEEIFITPTEYEKVGEMEFLEYMKGEKVSLIFYLYIATSWDGTIKESDEVNPKWFNINEIPYDTMFPDDKYWLPLVLEGKKVTCFFEFDEDFNIINYSLKEHLCEKSCGAIVIDDDQVLVIRHKQGHYGFPKGHVEKNETEIETAIREVKEETNVDIEVNEKYRYTVSYNVKEYVVKEVVFFLGTATSKTLVPQIEEVSEVKWMPFEEALKVLTYEDIKELLRNILKDLDK